jgi:hypothetical protein
MNYSIFILSNFNLRENNYIIPDNLPSLFNSIIKENAEFYLKHLNLIFLEIINYLINFNIDYIILSIYYTFFTLSNKTIIDSINKIQNIISGLLIMYYIKNSIDNLYIEREKEYLKIK